MSFSHDDVQRIIQLLNASHFDELHLEADGIKLDLRRNGAAAMSQTPVNQPVDLQAKPQTVSTAAVPASATPAAASVASKATDAACDIRAPMLGTFYSAPKPGAAPFVTVGSRVEPNSVIGIIEVMKLMNSVSAGVSGEVVELTCGDGDLVEYDQVLVRVRPN